MGLEPEMDWTLKRYNTHLDLELDPNSQLTPSTWSKVRHRWDWTQRWSGPSKGTTQIWIQSWIQIWSWPPTWSKVRHRWDWSQRWSWPQIKIKSYNQNMDLELDPEWTPKTTCIIISKSWIHQRGSRSRVDPQNNTFIIMVFLMFHLSLVYWWSKTYFWK